MNSWIFVIAFGSLIVSACSDGREPASCQISITNNGSVVYWDASKDASTAEDCKRKGSDAFSSFCTQNASLSFAESANLINKFEWKSSKPRFGEATVLSGSFGTSKCGGVQ